VLGVLESKSSNHLYKPKKGDSERFFSSPFPWLSFLKQQEARTRPSYDVRAHVYETTPRPRE
jgi:hypothetical protein